MIELLIKIPESEIPKQQDIIEIPLHFIDGKVCEAGGYGFDVLPKGHGRLIGADIIKDFKNKIKDYGKDYRFTQEEILNILERYEIKYAPTIIEADKGE